jgi:hypothetical protein
LTDDMLELLGDIAVATADGMLVLILVAWIVRAIGFWAKGALTP